MCVLLTRSSQQNAILDNQLFLHNIFSYSFPLLQLKEIDFDWRILQKYTKLIVTSKFAATLIAKNIVHYIDIDVIGTQSANILKNNPYIKINNIFFNIKELQIFYNGSYPTRCVYLSSNIIKQNLSQIDNYIIYNTFYPQFLDYELKEKIKNMEIRSVVLYSENCAKVFVALCQKANVYYNIRNIKAVVLSKQIYNFLVHHMHDVVYCKKPNNELMLELLYKIYA